MSTQQYTPAETRRNYILLVAEGILFTVGLVFFDPNTVLPLLMERLTGSAVLVGLLGSVQPFAKGIIPILSGNHISSMTHKKHFLVGAMSTGRLPLWVLGFALLWLPESPAFVWAAIILLVQILFWFGDAAGDPAWMDMVGKSVPDNRRGKFFATRQIVGGLLSIAAGALVAAILDLDSLSFPTNYGVVVTIGALIYLGNVSTFTLMVEHPSETSERHPLTELIGKLPAYLKANHAFAKTLVVLILFNMARLSLPFYIVFSRQAFGFGESALALFIPLQMIGRVVGTSVWGVLGDRYGHQRAIRVASFTCVLPSIIVLLAGLYTTQTLALAAFGLLFFILGAYLEGWPSFMNYMLESVAERERPMYAGLMGIGFLPSILAPVLGGVIIQQFGFPPLFAITAIVTLGGIITAFTLPQPERITANRSGTQDRKGNTD